MALIEKTADKIALSTPHENFLVVTNHFRDSSLMRAHGSSKTQFEDASHYRLRRVEEMIDSTGSFSIETMAKLLRDRKGKGGENIGLGNEKAINQLIAHHAIIFKPKEKKVWVSAAPYQLGAFVAYDLDEIFANPQSYRSKPLYLAEDCIAPDVLLNGKGYQQFLQYKKALNKVKNGIENKTCVHAKRT